MKKVLLIILLTSLFYGCFIHNDDKKLVEIKKIDRVDFPDSVKVKGEEFLQFSNKFPISFTVLRDTLVLTNNRPDSFYFSIYNIQTAEKIIDFARRGKGPNEFLAGKLIPGASNFSNLENIYVIDIVRDRGAEYNLDSLLLKPQIYNPNLFDLSDGVFQFSKLDSSRYICYNSYYFQNKKYTNNTTELLLYNVNEEQNNSVKWKYFTLNVSQGLILISPVNNKIIVPHLFEDKINIYSKNLELIKTLIGPDMFNPEYRLRPELGGNHISFKRGKSYLTYRSACHTNNSVYMVYVGRNYLNTIDIFSKPSEIFKFNWDGKLIKRYILDKYVYRISVSSDEKYLYGTAYNSDKTPILVRYKL